MSKTHSKADILIFEPVLPFVRSPYNYDRDAASDDSGLTCQDPSRTSQAFKEESDINWIIDNFTRTGDLPDGARAPQFGDFTNLPSDYHAALNQVRDAQAAFMTLSAQVRARFENDPGKLLAFMEDPKNREEAEYLGLVPKKGLSPASEAATRGEAKEAGGNPVPQAPASKKAVSVAKGDEGGE